MRPAAMPRLNLLTRCALLPWVKVSGRTVPREGCRSAASPIFDAAPQRFPDVTGLQALALDLVRPHPRQAN